VSDQEQKERRWNEGKREEQRSYLSELLDIVHGTGRRISAICALTYADLRLNEGPHGSIRWPADTDKMDRETVVPIGPLGRAALDRVMSDRPGIGPLALFPSPLDRKKPIRSELASAWLLQAEKLAKLTKQDASLWHAYRRGWATSRKHLPDVDVAHAGGWTGVEMLKRIYQQPDADTMLKVVLATAELREAK
jgi:integrase